MKRLIGWLLDLLYPPKCVFCRKLLERDERQICNCCRLRLPVLAETVAAGPELDGFAAALCYDGPVRESLLRYKFGGMEHYAVCYGELLAAAVSARLPAARIDAVAWVPVSRRRLRKRGYDQARLLARETAKRLNKPLLPLLAKTRDNPAQSGLSDAAERRANVQDVYRLTGEDAAGKTVLLIDDIYTTGATIGEAARVLRTGGAAFVYGAALAAAQSGKCD